MKGPKKSTKQPMSGDGKSLSKKSGGEVDLTHMPQFIKEAPWYLD
jgi:hypothetical protein